MGKDGTEIGRSRTLNPESVCESLDLLTLSMVKPEKFGSVPDKRKLEVIRDQGKVTFKMLSQLHQVFGGNTSK